MQPTPATVKKPVSVLTNTHWGPWKWQQRPVELRWTLDDRLVVSDIPGPVLFDCRVRDLASARVLLTFLRLRTRDGRKMTVDIGYAVLPMPQEGESLEDYAARTPTSLPSQSWWRENLQQAGLEVPLFSSVAAVGWGLAVILGGSALAAALLTF